METNNTIQDAAVSTDYSGAKNYTNSTNYISNGVASDYEMPGNEKLDKHEYADRKGMNQEYYPDPTYHTVKRRNGYFRNNGQQQKPHNSAPVYFSTRSKRYELIGIITRLCDLAGFELAERIVLRDKETGEVLR